MESLITTPIRSLLRDLADSVIRGGQVIIVETNPFLLETYYTAMVQCGQKLDPSLEPSLLLPQVTSDTTKGSFWKTQDLIERLDESLRLVPEGTRLICVSGIDNVPSTMSDRLLKTLEEIPSTTTIVLFGKVKLFTPTLRGRANATIIIPEPSISTVDTLKTFSGVNIDNLSPLLRIALSTDKFKTVPREIVSIIEEFPFDNPSQVIRSWNNVLPTIPPTLLRPFIEAVFSYWLDKVSHCLRSSSSSKAVAKISHQMQVLQDAISNLKYPSTDPVHLIRATVVRVTLQPTLVSQSELEIS